MVVAVQEPAVKPLHSGVTLEKPVQDPVGVGKSQMDNIGMFAVQKRIVLMAARKNIFVN